MEWNDWNGKRIFLKLKDGSVYSGKVIDVDGDFIKFIDKFNSKVTVNVNEIIKIVEENKW